MNQKQELWKKAEKQAAQIPEIRHQKVKDRQIVLLCETLKKAMKNENS